jgi:hypothetical protein
MIRNTVVRGAMLRHGGIHRHAADRIGYILGHTGRLRLARAEREAVAVMCAMLGVLGRTGRKRFFFEKKNQETF